MPSSMSSYRKLNAIQIKAHNTNLTASRLHDHGAGWSAITELKSLIEA